MISLAPNPLRKQRGLSTVEFAIVGALVFLVILGAIELSRAAFARSIIQEGVRRAARLGVVCPINDPYITHAARFAEKNWGATIIPKLTPSMITLQYLDSTGEWVPDPVTNFLSIRFVRVTATDYQLPLFIPVLNLIYKPGAISSTQPVESLGVTPTDVPSCQPPP